MFKLDQIFDTWRGETIAGILGRIRKSNINCINENKAEFSVLLCSQYFEGLHLSKANIFNESAQPLKMVRSKPLGDGTLY